MTQPVTAPPKTEQIEFDTLFQNARKEAIIIFFVWLSAMIWAVSYCYFNGYSASGSVNGETVSLTCGIPTWVFWGIAFPWGIADVFTIWFCLFYMKDDDLQAVNEEEVSAGQTSDPSPMKGEK